MNISFDYYGNLYLDNYQVNVDGKNNLILEKAGDIIDDDYLQPVKTGSFAIKEKNILQETIDKEIEDEENEVEHDFYDEEAVYEVTELDSEGPIYEDIEKKHGEHNKPFIFDKLHDNMTFSIDNRLYGDVCALYDTFIYQDGIMIFIARSKTNTSIYRLSINLDDGTITMKMIDYANKVYTFKDDHLILS